MTESERLRGMGGPTEHPSQTGVQLALLGALLVAIVLALVITDLATGGDTEPPAPLGSSIQTDPRTRVPILPTLAPLETATPVVAATSPPSSEADALTRDAQRLRDLPLLQAALAEYRDRFDEYPNSNGQVQTQCAYKELDKGCDLKEVLDEESEHILEDPKGEPLQNGYWYASDGETYTIWMLREGPANPGDPVCREVDPHLKDRGSLFCTTVGSASP